MAKKLKTVGRETKISQVGVLTGKALRVQHLTRFAAATFSVGLLTVRGGGKLSHYPLGFNKSNDDQLFTFPACLSD